MSARGPAECSRARGGRDGFVLIAVLWILAALAGLVGAYVAYALTLAQSSDFYLRRISSDAAISGGLELAVYDLLHLDPKARPPEGVFDYLIGDTRVQVRYAAEALRLDLNKASLESLRDMFEEKAGSRNFADNYARRIVAWREKADGQGAGMEDLSYRAAGVSYMPRHGPFQAVEELWDILDIPPDALARIMPFVTVYGGRAKWREDGDRTPGAGGNAPGRAPGASGQAQPAPGGVEEGGGPQAPGAPGEEQTLKPTRFDIRAVDSAGRVNAAEVVTIGTRNGDGPYNVLLWRTGDDMLAPRDGRRR